MFIHLYINVMMDGIRIQLYFRKKKGEGIIPLCFQSLLYMRLATMTPSAQSPMMNIEQMISP